MGQSEEMRQSLEIGRKRYESADIEDDHSHNIIRSSYYDGSTDFGGVPAMMQAADNILSQSHNADSFTNEPQNMKRIPIRNQKGSS